MLQAPSLSRSPVKHNVWPQESAKTPTGMPEAVYGRILGLLQDTRSNERALAQGVSLCAGMRSCEAHTQHSSPTWTIRSGGRLSARRSRTGCAEWKCATLSPSVASVASC